MISPQHLPIFVYGTLKRGQRREGCWPHVALSVEAAIAPGRLFDLGAYPAMIAGNGKVLGELWFLRPEYLAPTLEVLDDNEGFADRDDDLYKRVVIGCQAIDSSEAVQAYTYFYQRKLDAYQEILPGTDSVCRWPAGS